MLSDEEYVDDGKLKPMEIDDMIEFAECDLSEDESVHEPEIFAVAPTPDSSNPAVLKRSAEFFQRVESDSGSTDSAENLQRTTAKDVTKSLEANNGRKKLKQALSGEQASFANADSLEDLFTFKL